MSTVFTFSMKNTSSVGITCMRRSLAAGKSLPPSFCHAISGVGCPLAAHSRRAVFVVFTVISAGVFTNAGKTEAQTTHFRHACKQHICSLGTKYEDTQQPCTINGTAGFHGGNVQTIVVFWVSTLGSSSLSDISQKCTASILWANKCGSQVDAKVPGQKECVSSTGRLGGMLSSQEVHEEKGAGLVPTHHQEMKFLRMAIFRPNSETRAGFCHGGVAANISAI